MPKSLGMAYQVEFHAQFEGFVVFLTPHFRPAFTRGNMWSRRLGIPQLDKDRWKVNRNKISVLDTQLDIGWTCEDGGSLSFKEKVLVDIKRTVEQCDYGLMHRKEDY